MKRDDGAGTVLVLALVAVLITGLSAVAALSSVLSAIRRAEAAADLAALAAAQTILDGSPTSPCDAAATVAHANGAGLARCEPGPEGTVRVTAAVPVNVGPLRSVEGRARAGPPD